MDGVDPVHHDDAQLAVVISGDLAHAVRGLSAENDEVAGAEVRQHAHAAVMT